MHISDHEYIISAAHSGERDRVPQSQYGSVNPAAIVGAGIVATAVSTAVAVAFCKGMEWIKRNRKVSAWREYRSPQKCML